VTAGYYCFEHFIKFIINELLHSFLQMSLPKVRITNQKVKRLNNKHYKDVGDFSNSNEGNTPLNIILHKGPFNNYVDKMRGRGGQNVCFCPRSGYKNCPRRGGGGGQKMAKFCPHSC
jgi:hypothetical protein